jgi:hypothetical protein
MRATVVVKRRDEVRSGELLLTWLCEPLIIVEEVVRARARGYVVIIGKDARTRELVRTSGRGSDLVNVSPVIG